MERNFIMPDKIIRSGISEVFDQNDQVIARINYEFWSFAKKLELLNRDNEIVSKGRMKLLSLRPTWMIFDSSDIQVGIIKQLFTFFKKKYIYQNSNGKSYQIDGNITGRNFKIYDNNKMVIEVSSYTSYFSLRSHSYLVQVLDDSLDTYEVINLIEGIRNLVELSGNNSGSNG